MSALAAPPLSARPANLSNWQSSIGSAFTVMTTGLDSVSDMAANSAPRPASASTTAHSADQLLLLRWPNSAPGFSVKIPSTEFSPSMADSVTSVPPPAVPLCNLPKLSQPQDYFMKNSHSGLSGFS